MCNRCECRKCALCGINMKRWTSPSGQILHSFVTRSEPPFTFAYNPADIDMERAELATREQQAKLERAKKLLAQWTADGLKQAAALAREL